MHKKLLILPLIFLVLLLALGGCGGLAPKENKGPITLVDDFQRQVTLAEPAQRIISLVPSSTEILFALGVRDRIVGASEYCNHPEEALAIPRVGDFATPSIELIVSLEPDLVFAASLHKGTVEALEKLGIPVLALDPQNIDEICGNIELMAKAVGEKKAGEDLVKDMRQRLARVAEKVATLGEADRPVVFFEGWYPGISTAGAGTFIDEVITLAGGKNLAQSITRWDNIQEEEVLARNPDFIIHGYVEAILNDPDTITHFANREGWGAVTAVAEKNIYFIDPDIINRTSQRIVIALEDIARLLHPELFD